MTLVFDSAGASAVTHAHAVFEPGMHTVLGRDGAALDELVALAEGAIEPRRGQVLVLGTPPAFVPRARANLASLRAVETLPPGRDVSRALGLLLAARGMAQSPGELLARWELASWGGRRPRDLAPAEQRALALALALADERAALLLLYEPLVTSLPSDRVRAEVAERARGAVVLAATASLEDARMLGGTWHVLEGGTLDAVSDALRHGLNKALLVRSAEPRRLAAVLAADDHVSAVEWDEQRAPRELRVHGPDAAALASAVSSAALDLGLELELITPLSPSLEELLAARAALAQKAYEAAYARAPAPIFASPQSPPGSLPATPPGYAAAPAASPGYHSPAAPTPDLSLDIPSTPPRKENE